MKKERGGRRSISLPLLIMQDMFHCSEGEVDARIVMTTDPKPRLRWTAELHERFVDAVMQLGGPDKATPKTILKIMNVRGLTLYHLKSHLQKYRLGKQACKELVDNSNDVSGASENLGSESSKPPPPSILFAQELNDGCNEAMRVQMELQRRLHEQLEVQRHIQIRIEAQDKYLQSILERACNILIDPNLDGIMEHRSSRQELTELPTDFKCESLKMPSLSEMNVPCMPQITECSMDSCLTSTESPGKVSLLKIGPHPLLVTD